MIKGKKKAVTTRSKVEGGELPISPVFTKPAQSNHRLWILGVVGICLVVGCGAYVVRAMRAQPVTPAMQEAPKEEDSLATLIKHVASIASVPETEEPAVATVTDLEAFKKQNPVLYRDVQVGDRLFVWANKLVVYSEAQDRVTLVVPVNPPAPEQPAASQTEVATVEVRNGTLTGGLGRAAANLLKEKGLNVTVIGDAKEKTFVKSVVYNASGKSLPNTIQQIAELLKADVVNSLDKETGIKADIVVVIGQE
jgi:hypothetical protein